MAAAGLPPPWRDIDDAKEAADLVAELSRETTPGHQLHGRRLYAMARRDDRDDVLFAFEDGSVAEVHLTWTRDANPASPWTRVFSNADVWRDQLDGE